MLDYLNHFSSNPGVLFFLLIAIAWVWEDATVIGGALLAADNYLSIPLAVTAAFIGICSGDIALYYLGRLGIRVRRIRAWIVMNPDSRALRRRFRARTFSNILIIRFVPGLRTVGFTVCGLWLISLKRFLLAMSLAGIIWIAVVFTLIYQLGSSSWLASSPWKWSLALIALFLLVFNNVQSFKRSRPKNLG